MKQEEVVKKKKYKPKFQSPTGMHDILPGELDYYKKVYKTAKSIADFYDFKEISTPILEEKELFEKGTGKYTDIVEKEMFNLRTRGGDLLSLRPEFTPSLIRAYLQHGMFSLPQPMKLFSFGPLFRYEKPQAGRQRQFYQIDFEVIGSLSPVIDAQIIIMFYDLFQELKFKDLVIEINSIGCSKCRPDYKRALVHYLKSKQRMLSPQSVKRLKENPLRVLDSKDERDQTVLANAPQIVDYLCEECHNHFKRVLEFLDESNLPYHLNSHLVRGLDYYTKTVFEIVETKSQYKSQGSLMGGGRYDDLVKLLGGKDTPACGGAAGVERIINTIADREGFTIEKNHSKIFLAQLGDLAQKRSLILLERFRKKRIKVAAALSRSSLRAQLNRANKLGVDYTLIFGQKEALDNNIIVRNMKTGKQDLVSLSRIVDFMKKKLKKS